MAWVRDSGGSSASRGGRVSRGGRGGWRGRSPLVDFGGDGRRIRAQVVSATTARFSWLIGCSGSTYALKLFLLVPTRPTVASCGGG